MDRKPQAFLSSYAPRLRAYNNSLLTPVVSSSAPANPLSRTTKRGTTVINYAEDGYDYDDDDDDDTRRRPTGLRNLRREDSNSKADPSDKVGKDTLLPVQVQGIWRDWMSKNRARSDLHNQAQAALPVTLIPIRIDVDIPAFMPGAPYPLPRGMTAPAPNMDPTLYRAQELTVPYKLRDIFLWNLHETVITTDQFALNLVQDLDLPNQISIASEISKQIRTQLEEYAGVALHPLFHSEVRTPTNGATAPAFQSLSFNTPNTPATPMPLMNRGPETPGLNGFDTPSKVGGAGAQTPQVTATAAAIPTDSDDYNPDDTYRCIVSLNMNLASQVYTDKFEWSLLHPPGTAEAFAKVTCADLGLHGEWIPVLTHAIYEAVLRLKKEACESGGLVTGWGTLGNEIPNDAAYGQDAGWRYDPEHLADDWEPKIELLSKEDIEKREVDRERQIRRLRRETARFSNLGMLGGTPMAGTGSFNLMPEVEEERMGRGERSKKKRRFRSLSPTGRSGTPGGRGTPDVGGGGFSGGFSGTLTDVERLQWRCSHCRTWGACVWAVRDGPYGPRSLCANCGRLYEQTKKLPRFSKNLHILDMKPM